MKGRKVILTVEDVPVTVTFKKIKNLRMTIRPPEAEVRVSAPLRVSLAAVELFVVDRLAWIQSHRADILARVPSPRLSYVSGERLFVWGEEVELSCMLTAKRPKAVLEGRTFTFFIPDQASSEDKKNLLDRWLKREVRGLIPELLSKWEPRMGVKVDRFSVRKMSTRWGSCTPQTRSIRLNSELAKHSPECLEYVVVHELAHLIERSHNARFKAILDQFMPDWREIQALLNPRPSAQNSSPTNPGPSINRID